MQIKSTLNIIEDPYANNFASAFNSEPKSLLKKQQITSKNDKSHSSSQLSQKHLKIKPYFSQIQ